MPKRRTALVRIVTALVLGLAGGLAANAAEAPATSAAGPLSPEASLASFVIDPAVTIELVAAEPTVVDPVAVQFAADGSLWVVEMRDYPHGPRDGQPPQSRIKRLFDRDGDGRFEVADTFADQLLFVTGVLPYRDGLIVTLAGQVAFFADRDGDGVAEVRETWFSGFAQENSQLRANHPTYGPDGFVYIANGLRGGKITAERPAWRKSTEPLVITGFDFRFHPETGEFSTVNGHGQFGLTFDDVGHQFVCSNRNPCSQVMLDDRYVRQNPWYAPRQIMHDVCIAGENSQLFPISKAWTTSTLHANQFTAACGVLIFRGTALSPEFYGNAFTCDPTGNLVHREVLQPDGSTYAGKSPYDKREFLASPDTWFRPVNLSNGPDGALYIADMYRAVIEHPDFMPEELQTRPDLLLGNDRGRIYRVRSKTSASEDVATKSLVTSTSAELLTKLESPNAVLRETAGRLLIERDAREQIPTLTTLAQQGENDAARVTALRLLQQIGALTPDLIKVSLSDQAPAVRETALIVSEPFLKDAALRELIVQRISDADLQVRYQAVLTSSLTPTDETLLTALTNVCLEPDQDAWLQSAVLISARDATPALLARLMEAAAHSSATQRLGALCEQLAIVASAAPFAEARRPVWQNLAKVQGTGTPAFREIAWATLRGLGLGLRRSSLSLQRDCADPELWSTVSQLLTSACTIAADREQSPAIRQSALQTVRFADPEDALPVLMGLALDDTQPDLQKPAIEALASFPQPELAGPLLERFASATPAARRGILDVLLASDARAEQLLAALEEGRMKTSELDQIRAQRLTNHRLPALRERAQKIMQAATAERSQVLASYQPALKLPADPLKGRQIFEKQCVTCHRVGPLGVNVGPDIADTRTKTPDALLTAILDPNQAVDNNFFGYTVITEDGKVLTGIIAAETSASMTLRQPDGKMETILRADIEELRSTGASLMPVGFEKNISVEDMAHLISFLKNWRYLDGDVPLGSSR